MLQVDNGELADDVVEQALVGERRARLLVPGQRSAFALDRIPLARPFRAGRVHGEVVDRRPAEDAEERPRPDEAMPGTLYRSAATRPHRGGWTSYCSSAAMRRLRFTAWSPMRS